MSQTEKQRIKIGNRVEGIGGFKGFRIPDGVLGSCEKTGKKYSLSGYPRAVELAWLISAEREMRYRHMAPGTSWGWLPDHLRPNQEMILVAHQQDSSL